MDYYGYLQTFNSIIIETQIIATLNGFIGVFFIFWFNHRYDIVTKNKTKKISYNNKFKLSIATIIFIGIILFGISMLIGNLNTLRTDTIILENLSAQNKKIIEIPIYIVKNLDDIHTFFSLWAFFSFIYIVALIFSLDIFNFEVKKTKKKQKTKANKIVKKSSGGE
jgi:hypothetical protein